MIDFSIEIKKKNDNDDEEPQSEKDYNHDMKKKREEEAKKKLTDQELINKFQKLKEDVISKSQNQELGMEK